MDIYEKALEVACAYLAQVDLCTSCPPVEKECANNCEECWKEFLLGEVR